ncbi:jg17488 [Pararge aegeria aegeria]|uniref:Jg17488 protein n=1 Tax=Pararge aegeria aegeria TaxID=348720 RepID=A0A8S4RNM1_9NEOP|nr:jg17488 [Pararge aegeria aegeria]
MKIGGDPITTGHKYSGKQSPGNCEVEVAIGRNDSTEDLRTLDQRCTKVLLWGTRKDFLMCDFPPTFTDLITGSETAGPISLKLSENLRIDLASNPVKFGDDRSTPIFELSNCQIQLLFTMMIFHCWVYMGVDNDLRPLEKRIEENEYGEK